MFLYFKERCKFIKKIGANVSKSLKKRSCQFLSI